MIYIFTFELSESADSFGEYMFSKHQNINFSVEKKNVSSLWILNDKICGENGKFISCIYRKLTFSEIFTNYVSFNPTYQERGLFTHII